MNGWLFSEEEISPGKSEKARRIERGAEAAPEDVALVYTATRAGKATAGHFFMCVDDAKRFCSHPKTKGVIHGNEWAFFFTTLKNYLGNYLDLTEGGIDFTNFCDNGSRNDVLRELGIMPLKPSEVFLDLEKRGFVVKRPLFFNYCHGLAYE